MFNAFGVKDPESTCPAANVKNQRPKRHTNSGREKTQSFSVTLIVASFWISAFFWSGHTPDGWALSTRHSAPAQQDCQFRSFVFQLTHPKEIRPFPLMMKA
jgi:hypothetical protein